MITATFFTSSSRCCNHCIVYSFLPFTWIFTSSLHLNFKFSLFVTKNLVSLPGSFTLAKFCFYSFLLFDVSPTSTTTTQTLQQIPAITSIFANFPAPRRPYYSNLHFEKKPFEAEPSRRPSTTSTPQPEMIWRMKRAREGVSHFARLRFVVVLFCQVMNERTQTHTHMFVCVNYRCVCSWKNHREICFCYDLLN